MKYVHVVINSRKLAVTEHVSGSSWIVIDTPFCFPFQQHRARKLTLMPVPGKLCPARCLLVEHAGACRGVQLAVCW